MRRRSLRHLVASALMTALTTTTLTTTLVVLSPDAASAQTQSPCNPLHGSHLPPPRISLPLFFIPPSADREGAGQCPANTALGTRLDVDLRRGAPASFAAAGSPAYDADDGVAFSVARGGDAPQLSSLFYLMFERVTATVKAAPGAGIVSSLVLLSDALDEIDMEWLGSLPDEM